MAIRDAAKFFEENITGYVGSDPAGHNLNKGLLKLVEELHREVRHLHEEIAQLSRQISQIR